MGENIGPLWEAPLAADYTVLSLSWKAVEKGIGIYVSGKLRGGFRIFM